MVQSWAWHGAPGVPRRTTAIRQPRLDFAQAASLSTAASERLSGRLTSMPTTTPFAMATTANEYIKGSLPGTHPSRRAPAALTLARMSTRTASGSVGQASITTRNSGGIWGESASGAPDFAPLRLGDFRKSLPAQGLTESGSSPASAIWCEYLLDHPGKGNWRNGPPDRGRGRGSAGYFQPGLEVPMRISRYGKGTRTPGTAWRIA